jgi:hypothetical protein
MTSTATATSHNRFDRRNFATVEAAQRTAGRTVMTVLGLESVLGDELEGLEEIDGEDEVIVGAIAVNPRTGRRRLIRPTQAAPTRPTMRLPAKPAWRKTEVAPGVQAPGQGYIPCPLIGTPSNTFVVLVPNITFVGQVQEPYQPKRLLCSLVRTGASAGAPRVMGQLFVGTKLQQAQIASFDIELIGTANAFDVVLTCMPVTPGVFINLQCNLTAALAGADSILVNIMFLGNAIQ